MRARIARLVVWALLPVAIAAQAAAPEEGPHVGPDKVVSMGGGAMRIIAFLTDPAAVRAILAHLVKPTALPRIAPARGPPLWDVPDAGTGDFDPHAQPAPLYELDQRIAW